MYHACVFNFDVVDRPTLMSVYPSMLPAFEYLKNNHSRDLVEVTPIYMNALIYHISDVDAAAMRINGMAERCSSFGPLKDMKY